MRRFMPGLLLACLVGVPSIANAQICPPGTFRSSTSPGYELAVLPNTPGGTPWFTVAVPAGCTPCFGGTAYTTTSPCPASFIKNGSLCSGSGTTDTQTCTTSPPGTVPPSRCPLGSYKSAAAPATSAAMHPSSWGLLNGLPAGCAACTGGAWYHAGFGNRQTGTLCSGIMTSDSQSGTSCNSLSGDGYFYICGTGNYRSGTGCTGYTATDTQTCATCGNGGANYQCPAYQRKLNADACSGITSTDTNQCVACSNGGSTNSYLCAAGFFKNGDACSGSSTVDTQSCLACGGGGLGWNCGSGFRRNPSSSACTGTGTVDTQSCVACGNAVSGTYQCSSGDFASGSTCSGTSTIDTQTCQSCLTTAPPIPADKRCAPGERRVGITCTSALSATEVCATCGNGGAAYDCGDGNYRSGSTCNGGGPIADAATSPDTQTCSGCTGGAAWSCGTGNLRTGSQCDGTTSFDTQSCAACGQGGAVYACDPGTFRDGAQCTGFLDTDTQTCAICGVCTGGFYETSSCTGSQDTQCAVCPAGTYAEGPAASSCTPCPPGTTSVEGSSSPSSCTPIPTTTTTLVPTTTTSTTSMTSTTLIDATTTTVAGETTTTVDPTTTTEPPTTTLEATTTTTLASPCAPTPATGCRLAAAGASHLQWKSAGEKSSWKWSWTKGGATVLADFLDPLAPSSGYHVCLYDASAAAQPISQMDIGGGGMCLGKPCWKAAGTGGFLYKSKDGASDGITMIGMKAGAPGKAKLSVKGKGPSLPLPTVQLALPVVVQIVSESGGETHCWQTTFAAADANTPASFKATGP